MMYHRVTVTEVLLKVAGLASLAGDATFSASMTSLFGANGVNIVAAIGLAAMIAGQIIHGVNNVPQPPVPEPVVVPEVVPPVEAPPVAVPPVVAEIPAPIEHRLP